MHVRPATTVGLDAFVEIAGDAARQREVRRYLDAMFAAGSMRPEWCFVAEEDDRPVGRIAFWTLPGLEHPFALVLFDVTRHGAGDLGTRLLGHALGEARRLGADEIEHVVDDPPQPPQFQEHVGDRVAALVDAGFSLRRETDRFELPAGQSAGQNAERAARQGGVTSRLRFRTLGQVGEEAFVAAIERVSEGTLDREILAERERLGPEGAARDFFTDARQVEYDPSWWRLAFDADDALIGLVMPAHPPAFLTLFYIGVVPGMRGQGYVDDLLAAGTEILLHIRGDGETPLRTDTDVSNVPMSSAFERAGWTRFARRHEYAVELGAPSDNPPSVSPHG